MSESRASHNGGADVAADVSLAAILDCIALPVWVVDHEGLVVLANPAALQTLRYDELSQLQGRNGHDTIHYAHPDGRPYPAEDCPVLDARRSGRRVRIDEDWFFRRDGEMFPVSYTSVPIDLPTGRGVVTTFVDMTAQREAEQALRERDAILARVAQPVWVVDHRGCFHYANPAALQALGYDDLSELVGRPGHQTVHYKYPDGTPFPEEDCPVAQARWKGQMHQEAEDWLVRKDGSILRIAYSTAPFELPGGLGAVTAFTDIEAHLEAERIARERDVEKARAAELRAASRRIIEAADHARAQLTRDLHDGILTDRGLVAAVEALASRLPLPVSVEHDFPRRLPGPVEASVYFFVSEALTNVGKHARARQARVAIRCADDRLVVEVAPTASAAPRAPAAGPGSPALEDRIAALDGELSVTSPPGRGTTLHAEIPVGG
jgi:PAS domain S-box-containing protein